MDDYKIFSQKKDKELIKIIMSSASTPDGVAAKEILEYRKYCIAKRQNFAIVLLTVVLAITSVSNIILTILQMCHSK